MSSILIPVANISILQPVVTAQTAAAGALAEQELNAVARAINTAANTGATKVHGGSTFRQATLDALDSAGYTVAGDEKAVVTPDVGQVCWTIDWTPEVVSPPSV